MNERTELFPQHLGEVAVMVAATVIIHCDTLVNIDAKKAELEERMPYFRLIAEQIKMQ